MAMRMSGLMSGMDTESIVQQLVEAKSVKVTTAKKAQTKLSWKQDAWKDLNTKLKNLQSKFLSNMRFSTSYTRKVTKVSNPNAVSVITGENAVNGVQELEISQLAKTGYLTGGEVEAKDSSKSVDALTKISELDGYTGAGKINVRSANGSVDVNLDINDNTTISDVLTQLKSAGLNASFDAKWGRFSISAKESGAANDFQITALDDNGENALSAMKLQTNENEKYAAYYTVGADDAETKSLTIAKMRGMIDSDVDSITQAYLNQYRSLAASKKAAEDAIKAIEDKYPGGANDTLESVDYYSGEIETRNKSIEKWTETLNSDVSTADEKKKAEEEIAKLQKEVGELTQKKAEAESLAANKTAVQNAENQMEAIAGADGYITVTTGTGTDGEVTYSATATAKLTTEVEDRYFNRAKNAAAAVSDPGYDPANVNAATKTAGRDAVITLNGATYKNNNNTFEINGLTFTALAETKDAPITVTTEQDVDGIYDMVKNFLKEYNSIINEMDKLYNADAAKDYEPLSDEEKDVMSEKDIEKYEQKIKDSLLRRDENLSSVSSGLRDVMAAGIEVNGKTMHLFDFGIETLSYFVAPDNEKNAYHIAGDADDGYTSGNEDKLKTMIANDPDTVIDFFTKLSQNLYGKMSDMSKSVDGYRSFGNFYDDKKMKSDYDDYTSKIATLEQKLNDYEDSWYKKFSAMETAMAKMQQNANAVTSLLGG